MASNTLAPNGLVFSRNKSTGANTYSASVFTIQNSYAYAIGLGDLVSLSSGYVVKTAHGSSSGLGVFMGVLPYYDTNLQGTAHGLNGSYTASASPPSGVNISCLVITATDAIFRAQVNGGPFSQAWFGEGADFTNNTNGAPNAAGISTLSIDGGSFTTLGTLPFQFHGLAGVSGGPQDPANTNPWIEVALNPAWATYT